MASTGVLSGLHVVELAGVLAGPSIGQFCAELGARVDKVEPPDGDVTRRWTARGEGTADSRSSSYFSCVNWGKTSRRADLATPSERDEISRLVRGADVVISSFRPGSDLETWADSLREGAPRLIHLAVTAFPAGDPRPGFDAVIQAESGFMDLNREPGGTPAKMPVALMDVLLAHQLKEALLAALLRRERTDRGGRIAADLFSSAVSALTNQAALKLWSGVDPEPVGTEHPSIVPYGLVVTTADDRQLVLAVGNDRQFAALAGVLGLDDIANDPRYATNEERVRHREDLREILTTAFASRMAGPVTAGLREAAVPIGRVRSVREALDDPGIAPWILTDAEGRRGLRTFTAEGGLARDDLSGPPA